MKDKKYEFFGEAKDGLRRIRRIGDGLIGGWIQNESNLSHEGSSWVHHDARVRGNAMVYDNAQVCNNALIEGAAQVYGRAQIWEGAHVFGDAWVYDRASIDGTSRVYGSARVNGSARVEGAARVYGSAVVGGDSFIGESAWVYGEARIHSNMKIRGSARIYNIIKCASRSDGYMFTLIPCADKIFRVSAGCRFFTMEEAWKHWGHGPRANSGLGLESEDILVMFEHYIQRIQSARRNK